MPASRRRAKSLLILLILTCMTVLAEAGDGIDLRQPQEGGGNVDLNGGGGAPAFELNRSDQPQGCLAVINLLEATGLLAGPHTGEPQAGTGRASQRPGDHGSEESATGRYIARKK